MHHVIVSTFFFHHLLVTIPCSTMYSCYRPTYSMVVVPAPEIDGNSEEWWFDRSWHRGRGMRWQAIPPYVTREFFIK